MSCNPGVMSLTQLLTSLLSLLSLIFCSYSPPFTHTISYFKQDMNIPMTMCFGSAFFMDGNAAHVLNRLMRSRKTVLRCIVS